MGRELVAAGFTPAALCGARGRKARATLVLGKGISSRRVYPCGMGIVAFTLLTVRGRKARATLVLEKGIGSRRVYPCGMGIVAFTLLTVRGHQARATLVLEKGIGSRRVYPWGIMRSARASSPRLPWFWKKESVAAGFTPAVWGSWLSLC